MWQRKRWLVVGAAVLLVGASSWALAMYWPKWNGPQYVVTDPDHDGCWKIYSNWLPRVRMVGFEKSSKDDVIETREVRWDELEVRRVVGQPEVSSSNEAENAGALIPHTRTDVIDVGDTICTGRISQVWLYKPEGDYVSVWLHCPERGEPWYGRCSGAIDTDQV